MRQLQKHIEIFQCPACAGGLHWESELVRCEKCDGAYPIAHGIPQLFAEDSNTSDQVMSKIKDFYEQHPFPNYDGIESMDSLIRSSEKGGFAKLLDEQIPFNGNVLEVGCGTGQLSNFLGLANREVFGVDICMNSLRLANGFRSRNQLERVGFYQMNLFRPFFRPHSFSMVICNGVLHHTDDARSGFRSISKLVKKGGYIMIGLYNRYGRIPQDVRRAIFRLSNDRFQWLDRRLSRSFGSALKRETWFRDQYKNPHESKHTLGEVQRWFQQEGFEFISSRPNSSIFDDWEHFNMLFKPHRTGTAFERILIQLALALKPGNEGGFFVVIGRRKS